MPIPFSPFILPLSFSIDVGTSAYKSLADKLGHKKQEYVDPHKYTVSAIVPAYNEEEWIESSVTALFDQTLKLKNVIVVDDCSTDRTPEICQKIQDKFPDRFIYLRRDRNSGKAANINYVLRELEDELGDITYINDADCISEKQCVEMLARNFSTDDVAAVGAYGYVKPPKSRFAKILHYGKDWNDSVFDFRKKAQSTRNAIFVVCGAATAYRTDVLKKIPYPETTKTEDTYYTWKLLEEGYRVKHEDKAFAHSYDLESFRGIFNQIQRWYSGTFQCMYTHGRNMLKAKRMFWSTLLPSFIESTPYAAAMVSLPAIGVFYPNYALGFLAMDFILTTVPTAFLRPKSLLHIPEIYVFKYLGSAAWLASGIKTTFEKLAGKEFKWTNKWEKNPTKNKSEQKIDSKNTGQLEIDQGLLNPPITSEKDVKRKDELKSLEGDLK
jgi:cellulose synthase/poly-beta-1,6-N-acetylglucosamine synthase-like glycosyltransferase